MRFYFFKESIKVILILTASFIFLSGRTESGFVKIDIFKTDAEFTSAVHAKNVFLRFSRDVKLTVDSGDDFAKKEFSTTINEGNGQSILVRCKLFKENTTKSFPLKANDKNSKWILEGIQSVGPSMQNWLFKNSYDKSEIKLACTSIRSKGQSYQPEQLRSSYVNKAIEILSGNLFTNTYVENRSKPWTNPLSDSSVNR